MKNTLDATEFSGFPDGYQFRRSLCKEYSRMLTNGPNTDVLLLEARPGIGATSICAEYLETIEDPGILLTVHAGSRAGYSIPFLLEQALRQAAAILGENQAFIPLDQINQEWHRTLARLQRRAKASRKKLHLIIDGLYQIPPEDGRHLQDVIKDVLFIGGSDVKHVITWREDPKLPSFLAKQVVRKATIAPLSDGEAKQYLASCGIDEVWIKELVSSTGCVPAKLASVVRLHKVDKLNELSVNSSLAEYYELEWDALLQKSSVEQTILEKTFAFLVFSKRPLLLSELAKFVETDSKLLSAALMDASFVRIDLPNTITFSSNTHRDFLTGKLEFQRTKILSAFVDALVENRDSVESIQLLPNYFDDLGRDAETVAVLTPMNLDSYLAATQSLMSLRGRNELGLTAATRAHKEVDVYRFALQTSTIRSLEDQGGNEALLAALASTDRLDEALSLAESESTKEARLLLLAQYAGFLHKRGKTPDNLITESIDALVKATDLSANRDNALKVAEYLVGPYPDLGISIVEQCSNGEAQFKDAAYAHLALKRKPPNSPDKQVSIAEYSSRIADSQLQGFIRAAEVIFGSKSPVEILKVTSTLDGRQRSFFLRQWIRVHHRSDGALEISDYALDEVARDSSYLPSAADLRDFCLPLKAATELEKAKMILQRIEIQRTALLNVAPTVDRLRLDIEIARAKSALNLCKNDELLSDIYLQIGYLEDDGIRLECYCWLSSELGSFSNIEPEVESMYRPLIDDGINESTEKCLATTAEHLDVFRGAVSALVESRPDRGLQLVGKLNTEDRRDAAYRLLAERLVSRRSKVPISFQTMMKAIDLISSEHKKGVAIISCLRLIGEHAPIFDKAPIGLIAIGGTIKDPLGQAFAITLSIPVCKEYGISFDVAAQVEKFQSNLEAIDQSWRTPRLFYEFVDALAQIDKATASKLLTEYQGSVNGRRIYTAEFAELLIGLCNLTVVAYGGTLKHRLDSNESYATVINSVSALPSTINRATLLCDIACRGYSNARKEILDKVCSEQIMPLIRNCESRSKFTHERLIEESYTALFLWNQSAAKSLLTSVPRHQQDECKSVLVNYLLTSASAQEPYDDSNFKNSRITWAEAITIIEIIESMTADNMIASSLMDFVMAATSRPSLNEISSSQRPELARRLQKKIESDLPDPRNVKHDGWKIVGTAFCYKLNAEISHSKWLALITAAKAVPNTSDSVYVLSTITPCIPSRYQADRIEAMREAEARLLRIPSKIDSVRRAISLSRTSMSAEMEDEVAKRILRQAMLGSLTLKDPSAVAETQRMIVDQAYKIDSIFAEELVKQIDDDPARVRARQVAKSSLAAQKTKGAFLEKKYDGLDEKLDEIGPVGWQMLGGLNAGNVPGQRQDELSALVQKVSKCTLSGSMGFYWWYLRSLQKRYEHSAQQSRAVLLPVFEVTRLAFTLAERIGARVSGVGESWKLRENENQDNAQNFVAVPGSGQSGMDYIRKWMDECSGTDVLICDPYFKPENLDFVKDLSFYREDLSFGILTCTNEANPIDLESEYEGAWANIAHVQPPPLRAVHVTYEGPKSKSIIHDRWIFVGDSGIRVGTSLGSLIGAKVYELSKVVPADATAILNVIRPFVDLKPKELDGRRLKYRVVQW